MRSDVVPTAQIAHALTSMATKRWTARELIGKIAFTALVPGTVIVYVPFLVSGWRAGERIDATEYLDDWIRVVQEFAQTTDAFIVARTAAAVKKAGAE